jgi:hypothetical protein
LIALIGLIGLTIRSPDRANRGTELVGQRGIGEGGAGGESGGTGWVALMPLWVAWVRAGRSL